MWQSVAMAKLDIKFNPNYCNRRKHACGCIYQPIPDIIQNRLCFCCERDLLLDGANYPARNSRTMADGLASAVWNMRVRGCDGYSADCSLPLIYVNRSESDARRRRSVVRRDNSEVRLNASDVRLRSSDARLSHPEARRNCAVVRQNWNDSCLSLKHLFILPADSCISGGGR